MKDKDRIVLQKMDKYIQEILQYANGLDFEDFVNDNKTVNATAFLIGQLGELSTHISADVKEDNPQIPWKSMKGIRNKIVHEYENVDLAVLWGTVARSLPELSALIKESLAREASSAIEFDDHDS